jgi:hypothetical protein
VPEFFIIQLYKFVQFYKVYRKYNDDTVFLSTGKVKGMAEVKSRQAEIANKRVALTPSTWEALSNIKPPGKSLGETVADLITEHQKKKLERDLNEIDENGQFIPWEKAKKELGL